MPLYVDKAVFARIMFTEHSSAAAPDSKMQLGTSGIHAVLTDASFDGELSPRFISREREIF